MLADFNVRDARIFGSVARGEDIEGSDLDLIVDLGEAARLTDIFRIEDALQAVLGVRVDAHMPPLRDGRFARHVVVDARAI
ncbi:MULTISPECIES: nucleotidyltransferase family protein [unclassified Aureimonas]|uniref:nucleotidyltransferase family protein n=1 Tax=unclassified Aureimonas TaxID=2615206 RepID=UPI0006FB7BC8|nr:MULTISPECIES: nucleotidyltransferase domain-containing protein [unclassified Aureimonas]KQT57526.1 hypothetical protein ASG62_09450 [Aureimonas sp. Leaf427]KQT77207.1 hypothetical protein ASG54_13320 [Aureimonas sp. Leaf460]